MFINSPVRSFPVDPNNEASVGLLLAGSIATAWLALHIGAVFFFPWKQAWLLAPLVIAVQCWLYVGLFIVAHDCMHGSLVPGRPQLNVTIGRIILFVYAGFPFDKVNANHHEHHRYSGTELDPDFDERPPHGFWAWYVRFMTEYVSARQLAAIAVTVALYVLVFRAPVENIFCFWTIPALLSSLQLFTFGTYLPHRPGRDLMDDRHRARSNDFPRWLSLLTCFHFGYHREHHLKPGTPWWRLPAMRDAMVSSKPLEHVN